MSLSIHETSGSLQIPRPAPKRRYESLDFWRGFACLCIVITHAPSFGLVQGKAPGIEFPLWLEIVSWFRQRTSLGVTMFFVISGYCISVSAESARRNGLSIGVYFARRFRRIFPPYWAAIAVTAVFFAIFKSMSLVEPRHANILDALHGSELDWFANLSLTHQWLWRLVGSTHSWNEMFLGQSWTLCFEEQFYAVVGILLCVSRTRYYAQILLVTAAVIAYKAAYPSYYNSGYFFGGRWLYFAAGIGVYYDLHQAGRGTKIAIRALLAFGLGWNFLSPDQLALRRGVVINDFTAYAFALLLIGLYRYDRLIHTNRMLKPIAWCGTMCYSIYLTHTIVTGTISQWLIQAGLRTPVIGLTVVIPITLLCSVGLGYAFFTLVEKRFLNQPHLAIKRKPIDVPRSMDVPTALAA